MTGAVGTVSADRPDASKDCRNLEVLRLKGPVVRLTLLVCAWPASRTSMGSTT